AYFGEYLEQDCGNCDVCEDGREMFDATVLAQKALSCMARTNELINQHLLIDILRGAPKKEVQQKGYDRLKTFGVGNDLSQEEWADCIAQMINLGIIELAYHEGYVLKLNERSWDILKNGKTLELAKYVATKKGQDDQESDTPSKPKHEIIQDELFERLKELRKKIADREGALPQNVFSDTTLWEIARYKPIRENELETITGITSDKVRRYGYDFTELVLAFIREKKNQNRQDQNSSQARQKPYQRDNFQRKNDNSHQQIQNRIQQVSPTQQDPDNHKVSLQMYQSGLNPQQIADKRGIKIETVVTHLIKLHHEENAEIDFWLLLKRAEYEIIMDAVVSINLKKGDALKPLYEYLNEEYEYYKLRIALLLWEQEERKREQEESVRTKILNY
ncbi:MAG: hypothetical protein EAZ95_15995, partial [Bacteroidetes bacterium]